MKISDSNFTHKPCAVDPKQFRAQATGIGFTRSASLATGSARAQRVVDQTDPACLAAVPEAEGLPARTPEMGAMLGAGRMAIGMTTSPSAFKRRGG